jgi:FlaA1/EpsC-like NDP-sugar epimerase
MELILNAAYFVGIVKLGAIVWEGYKLVNRHFLTSPHDLKHRYGSDAWAVVTGASDGIGAEYCRQLSRLGFNIVLVSRTESKLKKVQSELDPDVKSKLIVADFSEHATIEFYHSI